MERIIILELKVAFDVLKVMQGSFRGFNIEQNMKYISGPNRSWKPGNELKEVALSRVDTDRIVEIICMTD